MKFRGRGLVQITGKQTFEDDIASDMARAIREEIDKEVVYEIIWANIMENCADWYPVELKWEKGKDTQYFWNEACAWAVENFGLPGENYITHPNPDHMLFLFKNKNDAILMTLKWI